MISADEQAQAIATLRTVRDALRWGESALRRGKVFLGHGTNEYGDEAVCLLLDTLGMPWDAADQRLLDARLLPMEMERYVGLMVRRVNERIPAPYLTGRAWFAGLEFSVDERVLIPRSPIAELIEQGFEPWLSAERVQRVLDLCTGGGCIAVALAYAFPDAQVDATDISDDALAVARQNISEHGLDERVHPRQGDGLAAAQGRYDLIVSNPPYVDAADMAALPDEYRHEPGLALASGHDGLDFTRTLLRDAADYLTDDGLLIVEVGNSWEAVVQQWPEVPFFWFEFERGGHGVFMLDRAQLVQWQHQF